MTVLAFRRFRLANHGIRVAQYLEENVGALNVKLSKEEVDGITEFAWKSDAITSAAGPR